MWSYNYTDELYHYGVKGMRWGVRRTNVQLGHPNTKKPKKTYSIPEKKSNHRMKLESKYQSQGMSKSQAEQAAAKRIRAEKFVAGAATMTVAAAAAYGTYKYKQYTRDIILDKGTELQTMMSLKKGSSPEMPGRNRQQYTSFQTKDKAKYEKFYTRVHGQRANRDDSIESVKVIFKGKQDTKIASQKVARDEFAKLYKNNDDFKDYIDKTTAAGSYKMRGNKRKKVFKDASKGLDNISDRNLKGKIYDAFNMNLVMDDGPEGKAYKQKYYDTLRKKGYNAIQDVNDQKYTKSFKTKTPIILMDGEYTYTKKKQSQDYIDKLIKEEAFKYNAKAKAKQIGVGAAYVSAYGSAAIGASKGLNKVAIKQYRNQHPNTKLSDKEILALLKKK